MDRSDIQVAEVHLFLPVTLHKGAIDYQSTTSRGLGTSAGEEL